MIEAGQKYFQHPLCSLAFGKTEKERLNAIISYSVVRAGQTSWGNLTERGAETKKFLLQKVSAPDDFDKTYRHWEVLMGLYVSNVTTPSIYGLLREAEELEYFVRAFEAVHGPDARCRMRSDIVWRTLSGSPQQAANPLCYRHFSVLAAIYSVIGSNQRPVLITREMIRCRSLGYKTPGVMKIALRDRKDGSVPLTDKQIRLDLDKLQSSYFSRVNPAPRSRRAYFSHRMTQEELIAAVAEKEFRRHKLKAGALRVQNIVQGKLQAFLSGPILSGPSNPEKGSKGPVDGQTGATTGARPGPLT